MALVSYPYASSDSIESDTEEAIAENPSFFFPFENSGEPSEFSGEFAPKLDKICPNLERQNALDGFSYGQPATLPLCLRPEFRRGFDPLKTGKNHADAPENETNSESGLNSADLYKLCGSQAKRFSAGDVNLIEIDGSSFVNNQPNFRFSDPASEHEFSNKKFKSSRLEKSKNQITFLAEHAKLHERELNLARASRFHNKRKTQGRYGF